MTNLEIAYGIFFTNLEMYMEKLWQKEKIKKFKNQKF